VIEPAPWGKPLAERLVAGIDPGQTGGVSIVDATTERLKLSIIMPVFTKEIGKKKRRRLDISAMDSTIQIMVDLGVLLLVVENVGAGFGIGGRELGEACGIIKALAYKAGLQTEWILATKWKKSLVVPADKIEAFYRAEALFPQDRVMIRGERGGRHDGKAESAMIALYGCRNLLGKERR
jgi:hypothetical protein